MGNPLSLVRSSGDGEVSPATARPAESAAYSRRRAITASAQRLNLNDKTEAQRALNRASANRAWQDEAWTYYDEIGEIKFAFGLLGNVMSRIRLYVGVVVDPDAPPSPVRDVIEASGDNQTESLADDAEDARQQADVDVDLAGRINDYWNAQMLHTDQSGLLRQGGINISVAGEGLLVEHKGKWSLRSTSEVLVSAGGDSYQLKRSSADAAGIDVLKKDEATVGRVWRQHPRYSMDPDSSMLGVRGSCEELLLLSRMIRGTARSKMNAGILLIADDVSVLARSTDDLDPNSADEAQDETDPLETELVWSLTDPIETENSAASVVPTILRVPRDESGKIGESIQYISLDRKTDEFLTARADRALDRIMQGIDVPKDVVTGLANVKYSNAVQIDESLYKAHVEPLVMMLCDALTEVVLWPGASALDGGSDEHRKFVVWYDPSEVVVRPNRSEDASEGYDKFLLSGKAWRGEHGFSETDAPAEEELALRMALTATLPPEIASALLQRAFPATLGKVAAAAQSQSLPPELQQMVTPGGTQDVQSPDVGAESTGPSSSTPASDPAPAQETS